MNISRDTATAFVLHPDKARGAMRESIYCRYDNSIYATTLWGSEFRILGVTNGEVYIPTYHRTAPPSIHWSTL